MRAALTATLTITWNDLRIFFSQPGNWMSLGLLPVVFTLILGFAIRGGPAEPSTLRVDVIDLDGQPRAQELLDELRQINDALLLCPLQNDAGDRCDLAGQPLNVARGLIRVRDDTSAALLVIPAGYTAALEKGAPIELTFYSAAFATASDPVRQSLETAVQHANSASLTASVASAVLDRISAQAGMEDAIHPWRDLFVAGIYTKTEILWAERPPAVRAVTSGRTRAAQLDQGFGQAVPGVGSLYVMWTVFGGMAFLQRERQRGTLQRLGAMPVRRGQVLGSKMLTFFTLGMLQYAVVFAVGLAVGLDFGPNPLLLLLVMAAFALCCTAIAFAIAPALTSERQAGVVAQLLALTLAPLGGAWWPLEVVPRFMQVIGRLSPVAWVMDAFRDLIFYGGGWAAILPEIGVLLAAAAILFAVGIRHFRYI